MSDGRLGAGALIKRALREAPSLQEGLKLTLILAMVGQAVTVITPVVLQTVLDYEILDPDGVDMGGCSRCPRLPWLRF